MRPSSSRAAGPITAMVARPAVASNVAAARPLAARRKNASVFWCDTVGVITRNRSSARRVTVPSISMPPPALSISV